MSDEIWEVAMPSGEIRRMTLDQLDHAFTIGAVHENTLIRESGQREWETLRVVAGLDEVEASEPSTTPYGAAGATPEPARASVLPVPDSDGGRRTMAGLGALGTVGPPWTPSRTPPVPAPAAVPQRTVVRAGQPLVAHRVPQPIGARPPPAPPLPTTRSGAAPPLPQGAFPAPARAQGAPAPVAPRPNNAASAPPPRPSGPPPLSPQALPSLTQTSRPPPLPANAFAAAAPNLAAQAPLQPSAPPPPLPAARSGPPPLPATSSGPPPLPTTASGPPPLPIAASGPPPLPATPSAPPLDASRIAEQERLAAVEQRRVRRRDTRVTISIGLLALATVLVILHRNGVLFDWSTKLGMSKTYASMESAILGPPGIDTPRGVERFLEENTTSAKNTGTALPTSANAADNTPHDSPN